MKERKEEGHRNNDVNRLKKTSHSFSALTSKSLSEVKAFSIDLLKMATSVNKKKNNKKNNFKYITTKILQGKLNVYSAVSLRASLNNAGL